MKRHCLVIFLLLAAGTVYGEESAPTKPAADAKTEAAKPEKPKAAPTEADFLAATNKMLGKLEEYGQILSKLTDKASAEAAKPKIEKLTEELKVIAEEAQALGEPPTELASKLEKNEEFRLRTAKITGMVVSGSAKVNKNEELRAVLQATMMNFQRASMLERPEPPAVTDPPKSAPQGTVPTPEAKPEATPKPVEKNG